MNSEKERNMTINQIMEEVGRKHGYTDVTAEFTAFRDFKIKWSRSMTWASFEVSDYLEDAPGEILRDLVEMTFRKIKGEMEVKFPESVRDWITSPEFVRNHRPTYLRRYVGLSEGTQGKNLDLAESYDRLVESGLLERDDDLCIRWGRQNSKSIGRSSVLMRVVAINDILDREDMYEDAIDYALYSEIAKVNRGFNPGREQGSPEDILARFRNHEDARFRLATFGVRV